VSHIPGEQVSTILPPAGWRSGLPARLVAAALVGAVTGGAALLTGHLMPLTMIPVDCHPAGGLGCAIGAPVTAILLGALVWLVVVAAVAMVVGAVLSGLSWRLAGVRLGIGPPMGWPVALWALAVFARPVGVSMILTGARVPATIALAFVLTAVLTAPQIHLRYRLIATGLLTAAVIILLAVR
jgi:hypothetical protein